MLDKGQYISGLWIKDLGHFSPVQSGSIILK